MPLACILEDFLEICVAVVTLVFKLDKLFDNVSSFEVHVKLIDIPESRT